MPNIIQLLPKVKSFYITSMWTVWQALYNLNIGCLFLTVTSRSWTLSIMLEADRMEVEAVWEVEISNTKYSQRRHGGSWNMIGMEHTWATAQSTGTSHTSKPSDRLSAPRMPLHPWRHLQPPPIGSTDRPNLKSLPSWMN